MMRAFPLARRRSETGFGQKGAAQYNMVMPAPFVPGRHHRLKGMTWLRTIFTLAAGLLLLALVTEAFVRLRSYGRALDHYGGQQPLKRIVMVGTPPWLSGTILDQLAREAVIYTCRNPKHPNYAAELRNPLNGEILKRIGAHYLDRQTQGMNAWIQRILFVRRVWLRHEQIIEIAARYRQPLALVRHGGFYYLISTGQTRLPGRYSARDVAPLSWLIRITGSGAKIPPPGQRFHSSRINTARQILRLLIHQPFAWQIRTVNVSNLKGRLDPLAPWITLRTIYGSQIRWGRPPGKEGFLEVPARRKIASLLAIYRQYRRIDAGRAYVDIRGDAVLVPRPAAPPAASAASLRG